MIATFHFVEIATSNDEAAKAADKENASRPAAVEIQQQSKGIGQHRITTPIVFPVIFRTEPHFTYGSAVISGPKATLFHDPRGSSGVWKWQRNGNGEYIGAYCWLRVDIDQITHTTPVDLSKVLVQHYMTFSAIAVKSLPTKSLTASLVPRTVGL